MEKVKILVWVKPSPGINLYIKVNEDTPTTSNTCESLVSNKNKSKCLRRPCIGYAPAVQLHQVVPLTR